ncbi:MULTISPECIES: hypothetical protein [Bacillus cereus group]|nr:MULTISPECIES: hypothetical protein [Bacillus cereus group]
MTCECSRNQDMIQKLFSAGDIKKERFGKRPSVTTIQSKKK